MRGVVRTVRGGCSRRLLATMGGRAVRRCHGTLDLTAVSRPPTVFHCPPFLSPPPLVITLSPGALPPYSDRYRPIDTQGSRDMSGRAAVADTPIGTRRAGGGHTREISDRAQVSESPINSVADLRGWFSEFETSNNEKYERRLVRELSKTMVLEKAESTARDYLNVLSNRAEVSEEPIDPVSDLKRWLADFGEKNREHSEQYSVKKPLLANARVKGNPTTKVLAAKEAIENPKTQQPNTVRYPTPTFREIYEGGENGNEAQTRERKKRVNDSDIVDYKGHYGKISVTQPVLEGQSSEKRLTYVTPLKKITGTDGIAKSKVTAVRNEAVPNGYVRKISEQATEIVAPHQPVSELKGWLTDFGSMNKSHYDSRYSPSVASMRKKDGNPENMIDIQELDLSKKDDETAAATDDKLILKIMNNDEKKTISEADQLKKNVLDFSKKEDETAAANEDELILKITKSEEKEAISEADQLKEKVFNLSKKEDEGAAATEDEMILKIVNKEEKEKISEWGEQKTTCGADSDKDLSSQMEDTLDPIGPKDEAPTIINILDSTFADDDGAAVIFESPDDSDEEITSSSFDNTQNESSNDKIGCMMSGDMESAGDKEAEGRDGGHETELKVERTNAVLHKSTSTKCAAERDDMALVDLWHERVIERDERETKITEESVAKTQDGSGLKILHDDDTKIETVNHMKPFSEMAESKDTVHMLPKVESHTEESHATKTKGLRGALKKLSCPIFSLKKRSSDGIRHKRFNEAFRVDYPSIPEDQILTMKSSSSVDRIEQVNVTSTLAEMGSEVHLIQSTLDIASAFSPDSYGPKLPNANQIFRRTSNEIQTPQREAYAELSDIEETPQRQNTNSNIEGRVFPEYTDFSVMSMESEMTEFAEGTHNAKVLSYGLDISVDEGCRNGHVKWLQNAFNVEQP